MTRSQFLLRVLVALAVAAVLGFSMAAFQVRQNEKGVVTRFGRPVRVLEQPGLYGRWPWPIERVERFDARLVFTEARLSEALTRDKRNVVVPVFAAWRVEDALRVLQALGTADSAAGKLDALLTSARNDVLGRYDFQQLVAPETAAERLAEAEEKILALVRPQAAQAFGLHVESVGLKRLALPEANTVYVFDRMRAERGQYAAKFRAEGRREADALRARTDAERTVQLAEARRYSEETRGRAEAEAARVYAEAHGRDPEFYRFLRELRSLESVARENTTVILDASAAPFRSLQRSEPTTGRTAREEKP